MKRVIYVAILLCTTLAAMWLLPALVRKATYTGNDYPFVYYGAVLQGFGLIDYTDKEFPLTDLQGNRYSPPQFDSLMPLLNFRQLMSDGRLPDSLGGYELSPLLLRTSTVIFRHSPSDWQFAPPLHVLFESMPKRVGLELPPDMFRLHNGIEFIDAASNRTDTEKSMRFNQAFDKAGFRFPAVWAAGNPTPRKPYDEGYFVLDSAGNLFHLKMVNGRPYVRDTRLGDSIDILRFDMYESYDKRFYGFLFDRQGGLYIVESDDNGGYRPLRLDMDNMDPSTDRITVMGNLLYWTVTIDTPAGRRYYALESSTLQRVDEHFIARTPDRWERTARLLFPCYMATDDWSGASMAPTMLFTGFAALPVNIVAAVAIFLLAAGSPGRRSALAAYVLLTGICGLLAVMLLPGLRPSTGPRSAGNRSDTTINQTDKTK